MQVNVTAANQLDFRGSNAICYELNRRRKFYNFQCFVRENNIQFNDMHVCINLVTQFKHTSASPKKRSSIFSAISIQLSWNMVSNVLFWSLSLCMFETNNVYNFLQIELKLEQLHLDHLYTGFLWSWMQACWLHLVQTERKGKKNEKGNLSVSILK